MWQLRENEIPYSTIKSNDIIIWQVVKNNLRPDSTLLLLREMNESCHLNFPTSNEICTSDLMSKFLHGTLKMSLTPVPTVTNRRAVCKNLSRSDFKRDKLLLKSANSPTLRSTKKVSRKNLFDCKSIDLLMTIESDKNEGASMDNLLRLFENNNNPYHEKLFLIENEYIKLYKACWHKSADKRPRIEEFYSSLTKFIDCLQL
jgi:hypothetical protein